jgi:antitoxin VapB
MPTRENSHAAEYPKTDAVRQALQSELRRAVESVPLRERITPLQDRILARPATGEQADKEFYDALSGDD